MIADRNLRRAVIELMVEIHLLSPEMAEYFVAEMDEIEIARRFSMYTGIELSAAGANQERATSFYPVCTPRDDDGTLAALNSGSVYPGEVVPEFDYSLPWFRKIVAASKSHARFGKSKPGP